MNGVLIIDKPRGLTSHDVVNCVRRILGQKSVGHLGTLDPAATGVLPLVLGSFTRLAQFYMHSEKTYDGVIRLGYATNTYDSDGEPMSAVQSVSFTWEEIEAIAGGYRGRFEQTPPPVSAKKVEGVRAYKLARKNQEVHLKPVQVEVKEFSILNVAVDRVSFRARVGSGTYIRSIAHAMGEKLGCGGHLASLRRTAVAEFTATDACSLEELECAVQQGIVADKFFHPRQLLPEIPSATVNDESATLIRNGRSVNLNDLSRSPLVKVFLGQRDLIAVVKRIAGTLFHPKIVLVGN